MAIDFERLARASEELAGRRADEEDNGLTRPAEDDESVFLEREEREAQARLGFDERLRAISRLVTRQPLNREIMMRILAYCEQERTMAEIDAFAAGFPEASRATENPAYMTKALVREGGLEAIERDAEGREVLPEDKEGLDEDGVDDLVASIGYRTSEAGRRVVEDHSPAARLAQLLGARPERADTFEELLRFIAEAPRSYDDIKELLSGRPVLETVIGGRTELMQPSVFVDKLERAGVLAWDKGWKLTEEGRAYLSEV